MGAMLHEAADRYVRETDGTVFVELGSVTPQDVSAVYRSLAVLCVKKQIARVLVVPGEDADLIGERALRCAITMMLLAGIPSPFRLALVADLSRATYRNTQRDLCAAGIAARLFQREEDAARWLEEPGDRLEGCAQLRAPPDSGDEQNGPFLVHE